MGIQNKLADGIDEVDIIIAGGKHHLTQTDQRFCPGTNILFQAVLLAASLPDVLWKQTLNSRFW
jgi:hypothetical protein